MKKRLIDISAKRKYMIIRKRVETHKHPKRKYTIKKSLFQRRTVYSLYEKIE